MGGQICFKRTVPCASYPETSSDQRCWRRPSPWPCSRSGMPRGTKRRKNDRAVRLLATVPIPGTAANTTAGNMYVFDISWVDQREPNLLSRRPLQYGRRRRRRQDKHPDGRSLPAGFKRVHREQWHVRPQWCRDRSPLAVCDRRAQPRRLVRHSIFPPKMVSAVSDRSRAISIVRMNWPMIRRMGCSWRSTMPTLHRSAP